MKKMLFILVTLATGVTYAQVGVGNTDPKATLDVNKTSYLVGEQAGIAVTQLTAAQIEGMNTTGLKSGTLVYATTGSGSTINAIGYWFYNGSTWVRNIGAQGPIGLTGAAGVNGKTVLNGSSNPVAGTGVDGDFYINTTSNTLFGPKSAGAWPVGVSLVGPAGAQGPIGLTGAAGVNGKTVLNGSSNPVAGTGVDGDFYINTTSNTLFGPKSAGAWPVGVSLVGPAGAQGPIGLTGAAGVNGKTVLNGSSNPVAGTGVDGDFYINTTSNTLFGPKSAGAWPVGVSLVGPAGAQGPIGLTGAAGVNGKTVLNGSSNPVAGTGVDGDFYINTTSNTLFGPKSAGAWPVGVSLVGPAGAQGPIGLTGAAGVNGKTVLNGSSNPVAGTGVDGDFYINTTSNTLFGPKSAGAWPVGVSLVGPAGAQGPIGLTGAAGVNGKTVLNGSSNPVAGTGVDGDFYINTTSNTLFGPKSAGAWPVGVSLVGPAGAQGPIGLTGAAGVNGKTVLNGSSNPVAGTGVDGDFYINTTSNTLFGPKSAGAWPVGVSLVGPAGAQGPIGLTGAAGVNGKTVLNGSSNPVAGTGVDGDFYINTTSNTLFGPKSAGAWPVGVSLVGPAGAQGPIGLTGAAGVNGKTVLNGSSNPVAGTGVDGDFYINTTSNTLFGPKSAGAWPVGVSLVGPAGAQGPIGLTGAAGVNGKTVLNGSSNPVAGTGVDGDFYINTTSNTLFGPKSAGAWPVGVSLVGPAGAQGPIGLTGAAGVNGKTVLNGSSNPVAGTGVDGDFYINTTSNTLFGPKSAGTWPVGVSLVGPAGVAGSNASVTGTSPIVVTSGVVSLANNGVTTEKLADNSVTITKLPVGATATTYLRGDGSWVSIPTFSSVTYSKNSTYVTLDPNEVIPNSVTTITFIGSSPANFTISNLPAGASNVGKILNIYNAGGANITASFNRAGDGSAQSLTINSTRGFSMVWDGQGWARTSY